MVSEIIGRISPHTNTEDAKCTCSGQSALRLASHQTSALTYMDACGSLGLFYGPGTGKTLTVLAWAYFKIMRGEIDNFLVVSPATMVAGWASAIDGMYRFEEFEEEGIEAVRKAMTVRSYQKVYRSEKVVRRNRYGDEETTRVYHLRDDIDHRWDALIIDESHHLGGHSSVQTKTCMTLARLAKHRFILTGTPVDGGGGQADYSKLFGQISILDPDRFRNWTAFCGEFVKSMNRWHKPTMYHEERCRDLMSEYAISCRLRDVADLPAELDEFQECPLMEKKVYDNLRKMKDLEQYGIDIKVGGGTHPKLLQVCSGSLKRDDGTTISLKCSKEDVLADRLRSTTDPIVVFCRFRHSIDTVVRIAESLGKEVLVQDGRSKRSNIWEDFQEGSGDVLVIQYSSGGEGLNVQRSSFTIYYEPTLSALDYKQSRARIMRLGQVMPCLYLHLITPKTVEEKVWETIRKGHDVTDKMFEEWAKNGII